MRLRVYISVVSSIVLFFGHLNIRIFKNLKDLHIPNTFSLTMAAAGGPQYELGTLVGGTWRQWANAVGQDIYENIGTRATQYSVPVGWEDADTVRAHQAFQ